LSWSFKIITGVDHLVEFEQFFELLAVLLATDIGPVLKQQILRAFKDLFMLGGCLAAFAGSDFVDDAAKSGDDMKLVKDNFSLWQFFLGP
jgi:hypothetical protein